jgi:hypothetical protein
MRCIKEILLIDNANVIDFQRQFATTLSVLEKWFVYYDPLGLMGPKASCIAEQNALLTIIRASSSSSSIESKYSTGRR